MGFACASVVVNAGRKMRNKVACCFLDAFCAVFAGFCGALSLWRAKRQLIFFGERQQAWSVQKAGSARLRPICGFVLRFAR